MVCAGGRHTGNVRPGALGSTWHQRQVWTFASGYTPSFLIVRSFVRLILARAQQPSSNRWHSMVSLPAFDCFALAPLPSALPPPALLVSCSHQPREAAPTTYTSSSYKSQQPAYHQPAGPQNCPRSAALLLRHGDYSALTAPV